MKSQVVVFVCSVLVDLMLMSEAAKFPTDTHLLPERQAPSGSAPAPALDLSPQPTTNMFERYSSSSFGGIFPSPYWNNNNNRGNFNSWPYPYNPGYQPNNQYNPINPYDQYNPYYPYNYFGGSYGGGNYPAGGSNPIGVIGAAKPGTAKINKN